MSAKLGFYGRGADQGDGAILDIRQEAVLLGTVEAVDFVHEEQGFLPSAGRVLRGGKGRLQIRDAQRRPH